MLEVPSLFPPGAVVKSALSVSRSHWPEPTFGTGAQVHVCPDTEGAHSDMSRDPKRRRLLGRSTRFLRFFEERHFEVRSTRRRVSGAKLS